jgi:drug/metabolite transporter (DMT)-like permease
MQKIKFRNYLHLHFLVFIWGFTAILGALIRIDAISLVWYRMGFAVVILGIYFWVKGGNLRIDTLTLAKFSGTGFLIALHWIFFFAAIKVSNVSIALVAMSTGALFTSLIEPFFFKRKLNPLELFFGLLVVSGLYVIFNVESQYTLGIVYSLFAAFLWALFTTLNGLFIKEHKADTISFYQLLSGVICISIYLGFSGGFQPEALRLTTMDLIYLLILASICTAYAFVMAVKLMRHLTPFTVMLTTNLEPVYAILLALLIFGEREYMSLEFYLGATIILATVVINGYIKTKKNTKGEKAIS